MHSTKGEVMMMIPSFAGTKKERNCRGEVLTIIYSQLVTGTQKSGGDVPPRQSWEPISCGGEVLPKVPLVSHRSQKSICGHQKPKNKKLQRRGDINCLFGW